MKSHPDSVKCGCPNSPNYYWSMAQSAFLSRHHGYETEMYMYLLLYAIATQGE